MDIDHLPGTGGVVRFPVERRAKPTLMLAEELAPRSDLADAMADERANGEDRPDTLARTVEAFTALATALEFSMGVDPALEHLRAMNAVQVQRACTLGWAYQDAEAAAEKAELQLKNARTAGFDGLLGGLHEQVRRSRALWTACALAARAAADAARGAKEALDCHESGEVWRRHRTGDENDEFLLEAALSFRMPEGEPA